jgi:Chlorophyll A-B binding protein
MSLSVSLILGFDPLGIVKSKEQLFILREAEIKHARIAMLAAIGWPVSELCHYTLAKIFGKSLITQII